MKKKEMPPPKPKQSLPQNNYQKNDIEMNNMNMKHAHHFQNNNWGDHEYDYDIDEF